MINDVIFYDYKNVENDNINSTIEISNMVTL